MPKRPIRVLCVDDHSLVREGLTAIINLQSDIRVVASAATGEQAVELFRQHQPDITLMDLQLPGLSGQEAIGQILAEFPGSRIIVLTMYEGDEDIYRALRAGAVTYLLKDTLSDDLVRVMRKVHEGEQPMLPDVATRLLAHDSHPTLSPRETEVIKLLLEGMRDKEIAAALGISEETIHTYVKKILFKLGVQDRTAAVTVALRRGILHIR